MVPDWFGWRCVSWSKVNVVFENGHDSAAHMLPIEELEVLSYEDPKVVNGRFSVERSDKNGDFDSGQKIG